MSEEKIKRSFNTKLHEVCNDDKLRPILQCVYFDNGFAYASNGHIAIKQSLEYQSLLNPENLDGKLLHRDNYKSVMSFEIAECFDDGIACRNKSGAIANFEFYKPAEGEKIPKFETILNLKKGTKSISFIGFNPEYFIKLSKALYAPQGNIRVQFTGVDSAILVDVIGIEDQNAIIMPYLLNDTLFK